jgi:hypothetical protein
VIQYSECYESNQPRRRLSSESILFTNQSWATLGDAPDKCSTMSLASPRLATPFGTYLAATQAPHLPWGLSLIGPLISGLGQDKLALQNSAVPAPTRLPYLLRLPIPEPPNARKGLLLFATSTRFPLSPMPAKGASKPRLVHLWAV